MTARDWYAAARDWYWTVWCNWTYPADGTPAVATPGQKWSGIVVCCCLILALALVVAWAWTGGKP